MKNLCNINCCDQETYLITENLSRSTLKPPLTGDCLVWHDIYCEGRKWEVEKSKRFKQRQAERQRENKVTAEAKSWHKEWSAVRAKEQHRIDCKHETWREGREGGIAAFNEMKFWQHSSLLLKAIQILTGNQLHITSWIQSASSHTLILIYTWYLRKIKEFL